jgi:hypothetical protein
VKQTLEGKQPPDLFKLPTSGDQQLPVVTEILVLMTVSWAFRLAKDVKYGIRLAWLFQPSGGQRQFTAFV